MPEGSAVALAEEDKLRADMYALLAHFLSKPPSQEDLKTAANLSAAGETPLARAIESFARVAARAEKTATDDEYQELFIGIGRGELLPYGSYYLTGFLHEKPLARLRDDMAALNIASLTDTSEPEDHVAAILEMMAGIIRGSFGASVPLERQKEFFDAHIDSWMPVFFRDLEGASASVLYASLAQIANRFLEVESTAFSMD